MILKSVYTVLYESPPSWNLKSGGRRDLRQSPQLFLSPFLSPDTSKIRDLVAAPSDLSKAVRNCQENWVGADEISPLCSSC